MQIMSRIVRGAALAFAVLSAVPAARGDSAVTLSGERKNDLAITNRTDTTVNLDGVKFSNCSLKFVSDNDAAPVTVTLNLMPGTTNTFKMTKKSKELIKATKKTNLVISGSGVLELRSEMQITDKDSSTGETVPSALLVCNNLTVSGGDTKVVYDSNLPDTYCVLVKGDYRQTGGKFKVDASKKNNNTAFSGVRMDSKDKTFTLEGGKFNVEIAGSGSSGIDMRGSCSATFTDGEVKCEFEGPEGHFINDGTIVFNGGSYNFTTNITTKMNETGTHFPTNVTAVKTDKSITINGGKFEADLPLFGSEVFKTSTEETADISITGGEFDLIAGNDCISAKGDVVISGGRIRAVSTGDDAIDANGSIIISGGDIRAYATCPDTHGLDVNSGRSGGEKKTLSISGGVVIATDGPGTHRIGENYDDVGKASFVQPTYYGNISPAFGYSQKYLLLQGQTNGVNFTVKPCLPALSGTDFNLLVSVPGRSTASKPAAKTADEAYADRSTQCPMVFEKKATVSGRTVTTKEGAVLTLPAYYDLDPATGKSKTIRLSLNETAVPEITSISVGSSVQIGSETLSGLTYQLQRATTPDSSSWTAVGSSKSGTGAVQTFTDSSVGSSEFYRMSVTD